MTESDLLRSGFVSTIMSRWKTGRVRQCFRRCCVETTPQKIVFHTSFCSSNISEHDSVNPVLIDPSQRKQELSEQDRGGQVVGKSQSPSLYIDVIWGFFFFSIFSSFVFIYEQLRSKMTLFAKKTQMIWVYSVIVSYFLSTRPLPMTKTSTNATVTKLA